MVETFAGFVSSKRPPGQWFSLFKTSWSIRHSRGIAEYWDSFLAATCNFQSGSIAISSIGVNKE
jgi:hypothetical protein